MAEEQRTELDERLSRLYAAPVPETFETGWRADIRQEESIQAMKKDQNITLSISGIFRRAVPALCALVLAAGGLWVGGRDAGTDTAVEMVATRASGSTNQASYSAKMALYDSAPVEEYEAAAAYDLGVTTYGSAPQAAETRKLVRTADLTIRTKAFDESLQTVQDKLSDLGGYIENLYQYGEDVRRLHLNMRVPSARLDEFLSGVEGAGRVTDRSESTTDMTVQYQDNQARLNTLYQKRDRLNELLLKAEDVSDLIEIESAIADTQYQIDSYETSQRSIDRQVDMSAVNLTLIEEEVTVINPELTLAQRIRAGFEDSVEAIGIFLRNVVVFAVMAAPAVAVAAVLWILWRIVRKLIKKREE